MPLGFAKVFLNSTIYSTGAALCQDKAIKKLNDDGLGMYLIYKNQANTHFMHTESTVSYFRTVIKQAFDLRRNALNLQGVKGMLLADAFSGNASRKEGGRMDESSICAFGRCVQRAVEISLHGSNWIPQEHYRTIVNTVNRYEMKCKIKCSHN